MVGLAFNACTVNTAPSLLDTTTLGDVAPSKHPHCRETVCIDVHKSMMWLRQMAQLSTTISGRMGHVVNYQTPTHCAIRPSRAMHARDN